MARGWQSTGLTEGADPVTVEVETLSVRGESASESSLRLYPRRRDELAALDAAAEVQRQLRPGLEQAPQNVP